MQLTVVLTVAQGKRLIARAVAQLPEVRQAMANGLVAIGRGTTNAYVAEELLAQTLPKGEYVAGRTLPPGVPGERLGTMKYPDIVLKDGQRVDGQSVIDAVEQMKPGDVFIKGGNALNYETGVVGVLVGHPMGGTISVYGALAARKAHLIIPIGLEKLVIEDINRLSRESRRADNHPAASAVSLLPITGTVVTEIEAFKQLAGVDARLLSSGGVAGAEGAIWLLLQGSKEALDCALALHASVQQEPNLGLTAPE